MKTVDSLNVPIVEDRDGERAIGVQTEDIAGNKSIVLAINIKKDATLPNEFEATIPEGEIRPRYFIINASTTDEISGNEGRGYKLRYKYYITGQGQNITSGDTSNGGYIEAETYKAEGLLVNKSYTVYVEAKDGAGNVRRCKNTLTPSTIGELKAPNVKVEGPNKGNNDWYTGNPTITEVKDGADKDRTGVEKFKYKIDENGEEHEFDPNNPPKIDFPEGDHTLVVWGEDPNGTKTPETKIPVRKDTKAPNPPTISPSDGNWKNTSTVAVTITRGEDIAGGSGANKISYNGIDGQSSNGEVAATVTKMISNDGTYTVTAKTIDLAGNESSEARATVKKDSTPPSTSTLELKSKTANTITVTAKGKDATSGVAKYQFQYRIKGNSNWSDSGTETTSSESKEYTYPNSKISAGKTYELRVIVIDNAGNKKYSDGSKSDGTGGTTPLQVVTNTAPVMQSLTVSSKGTNYATIQARATDADGDKLTYTFYWGTNSSSLSSYDTKSNVTQNSAQTAKQKTGLSEYTLYYYRVDVSDGTVTVKGDVKSVRTYCPGGYVCTDGYTCSNYTTCNGTGYTCPGGTTCRADNYCSGTGYTCPGGSRTTCTTCWGSGQVHCPGTPYIKNSSYTSSCPYCGTRNTSDLWGCDTCGLTNTTPKCSNCGRTYGINGSTSNKQHSDSYIRCSACGGDGYSSDNPCSHGEYSSHSYCSHGYTYGHWYCNCYRQLSYDHTTTCTHGYTYSHSYCRHGYTSSHTVPCEHNYTYTHSVYCSHGYAKSHNQYCSHNKIGMHDS